jgi:hypothetical protein
VAEAYRELIISLDKFKVGLLDTTDRNTPTFGLRGVWANRVDCICQNVLSQAVKFMEEMEARKRGDLLGLLKMALYSVVELAQLVEGFELEPLETDLKGIGRELASSRARVQTLTQPLMRSNNQTMAREAHEMAGGLMKLLPGDRSGSVSC